MSGMQEAKRAVSNTNERARACRTLSPGQLHQMNQQGDTLFLRIVKGKYYQSNGFKIFWRFLI